MNVIHKYPIEITDLQQIGVPSGTIPLKVAYQHGRPCIWVKKFGSIADYPDSVLTILIVGTGRPCHDDSDNYQYLDSIFDQQFVWHIFWKEG